MRWIALASALAVGCGPSANGYPFIREAGCEMPCEPDAGTDAGFHDGGPPMIPNEPLESWDTADAGPLSGIFGVEVVVPAQAVISLESRQIYRLRLLQRGQQVRMRISPCRFALPSVPSVATLILPPRLEDVLRSLAIENEGPYLSAADPIGATFSTPSSVVVLGANLTNPATDPLPTMDMLDTAFDQDMDGNPGVTIDIDTVLCRMTQQAYIALRTSVAMTTTIQDLDRFEGMVMPGLDQSVLGVSDSCLTAATTLMIQLLPGAHFTALRVGAAEDLDHNGNVSCPELGWYASGLFGDYWSNMPL